MQAHPFKTQFANAMRTLLRPVIRQLIAHGVSYPMLDHLIRQLYVDVAERDFALPFKRQTDSRLALVTGINRKEVATLRGRRVPKALPRDLEESILTHVIGRWMSGPPYASADGTPRRLPYEAGPPVEPSFARLVRERSIDIPVRAVLDELIQTGAVELAPNGDVVLCREGRIVANDIEAKIGLLGSEPAELFATIARNIDAPERPWLQRKVVYDNVGTEALEALEAEARQLGEEFIRRANVLLASYDRDRNPGAPGGARVRVVLGAYYFAEGSDQAAPDADTERKSSPPPGRIRRNK